MDDERDVPPASQPPPLKWPRNTRQPISPVILRHPPTHEELLDSLPWLRLPAVMDSNAPDEGRSRVRFLGYRDEVTYDYGSPVRVRFRRFELLPKDK